MELKVNYDKLMQDQISALNTKKKLILQCCCGPCSTAVIERLSQFFDITLLYYNPNIYPQEEYNKRYNNLEVVSNHFNYKVIKANYNEDEYLSYIKGKELEQEGGSRCDLCFELRLKYTAQFAKQNGFDFFGTTLTVSSHKNAEHINKIGEKIEQEVGIKFLYSDFKKHDGYKRSIELSKQLNLYRQNYCGCKFSYKGINGEV